MFVPAKIPIDGGLRFYRSRIQGPDVNLNAAGGGGDDDDDDDGSDEYGDALAYCARTGSTDDDGGGRNIPGPVAAMPNGLGAHQRPSHFFTGLDHPTKQDVHAYLPSAPSAATPRGQVRTVFGARETSSPGSPDLTAMRRARELRFATQRNTPPMARLQQSARRSSVSPRPATPLKRSTSPDPDPLFVNSMDPIEHQYGLSASQRVDIEAQEDIAKVKRFEEEELLREVEDYELKIALQQIQEMEDRDGTFPNKRVRTG